MEREVKLIIECDLIGQMVPLMKIYFDNRVITLLFHKSQWGNTKALIEIAKMAVDVRNRKGNEGRLQHGN
ncbi:MAG: hypothetical protein M3R27_14570 [Bacteroidota bacterium]|nr:hypothetical protein [Bacteroidota bacterium]